MSIFNQIYLIRTWEVSDRIDIGSFYSATYRTLVQFNLPSELSGAIITSSTLRIYYVAPWSNAYPNGSLIQACRVTHDWVEATGNPFSIDGATWNEYNNYDGLSTNINDRTTPGGDYSLTDCSTITWPSTKGYLN
jgi:hypothetical protein